MDEGKTLIERLRQGVPCGMTLGHGQSCSDGYLCDGCSLRLEAINTIARLGASVQILEKELMRREAKAVEKERIRLQSQRSGFRD